MRRIKIEFPKANIVCYAKVLEDKYPEVADELWEAIAEPMVCEAHNTLSTGDYVQCRPIPPYHVPKHVGDQSNPLGGGDVPALCDCKTEISPGQDGTLPAHTVRARNLFRIWGLSWHW